MIGNKIKELRKSKGLSQEELAENAKINVRTIQRIENNENEAKGKTLNLICLVLDVDVESLMDFNKREDLSVLSLLHLSVLLFLVLPLGNIILPLILWVINKNKIKYVKETGENILNFQIIWTIVTSFFMILGVFGKILKNHFKIFIVVALCLYLLNIICAIVFSIKTNKGNPKLQYPIPYFLKIIR